MFSPAALLQNARREFSKLTPTPATSEVKSSISRASHSSAPPGPLVASPLTHVAATLQLQKRATPTGSRHTLTKAADAAGISVPPLNGRARLAAWLQELGMGHFFAGFITAGFDDINFVAA